MATLIVGGLDDEVRRLLSRRAATNDRSLEAEARAILSAAVSDPVPAAGGPGEPDPGLPDLPGLTGCEARVAGLVADGLSNRQIAGVLFVSERTVESHVSAILRKLGFRSRARVASWYSSRTTGD